MKTVEIAERLRKIKSDIESAFEKELIDFDRISRELSEAIDALMIHDGAAKSGGRPYLKIENYV